MAMKMTDEARKKLKTIMQTKLIEMVGHCEAELPDYIVSMIVNSKSKEYLVRNLFVFIGNKAEAFSDWLLELQNKIGAAQEGAEEVKEEADVEVKEEAVELDCADEVVESKPKEKEPVSRKRRSVDNDDYARKSRNDRHDSRYESSRSSDLPASKVARREEPRRADDDRRKLASTVSVVREPSPVRKTVASSVTVMRKVATENDDSAKTRPNIFRKAVDDALRVDSVRVDGQKGHGQVHVELDTSTKASAKTSSNDTNSTVCRRTANGTTVRVLLDKPPHHQTNGEAAQKPRIVWDLGRDEETSKRETKPVPSVGAHEDQEDDRAVVDALIAAVKLERAMKKDEGVSFEEDLHMDDGLMEEEWMDKSKTRCSFWPKCARGDECAYAHPTIACRNFPRCSFGKYCLYVHPMCKFGDACFNAECSAIHGDAEAVATICKLLGTDPSDASPSTEKQTIDGAEAPTGTSIACRYGSRCLNPGCTFIHPPECRYGASCYAANCAFRHPHNKYQWKASF